MNQSETIFDKAFEDQLIPRRRDLMPKWLNIYMWVVISFGFIMLCYAIFSAFAVATDDVIIHDPDHATAFRVGTNIGQFMPGIFYMLMGGFVWLERRRAIRLNIVIALLWLALTIFAAWNVGLMGLSVGIILPFFIPYWIGLLRIQKRWEKQAIRGEIRF